LFLPFSHFLVFHAKMENRINKIYMREILHEKYKIQILKELDLLCKLGTNKISEEHSKPKEESKSFQEPEGFLSRLFVEETSELENIFFNP